MTIWLKQSTAIEVVVGPFVDDTDFKTPETALTLSQADCQLSKNAGAFAQKNDATSATALAGGHYKVPLNSTDTNTLGMLRLYINESGALPVWMDFMIVPANVWDSMFASDKLQVDVQEFGGTTGTFADGRAEINVSHWRGTAAAAPTTAGVPKVAVEDATSFAQTAADKVWSSTTRTLTALGASLVQEIWDRATSALTTVGSIGKLLVDNINATISSRLASASYTAPDNASIATILTRTDVATSTRATPAQVNAEVLDVMNVDTHSEPAQGAPGATISIFAKINYMFKAWRNKSDLVQATGVHSIYDDAGTVVDHKRTNTDAAGVTTVGEVVSGP